MDWQRDERVLCEKLLGAETTEKPRPTNQTLNLSAGNPQEIVGLSHSRYAFSPYRD